MDIATGLGLHGSLKLILGPYELTVVTVLIIRLWAIILDSPDMTNQRPAPAWGYSYKP